MGTRGDYVWTLGEFPWEVTGRNKKGDINWSFYVETSNHFPFHFMKLSNIGNILKLSFPLETEVTTV